MQENIYVDNPSYHSSLCQAIYHHLGVGGGEASGPYPITHLLARDQCFKA